jgi:hypothetical protein
LLVASVRWILDHPYGVHADEIYYLNQVLADIRGLHDIFQNGIRHTVASIFLHADPAKPPAYRLIALPVLVSFGYHTATARFVSLVLSGLSAWFLYLTAARLANRAAGALAVLLFLASPEVLAESVFFSTEAPLFLAVSAMFYFLVDSWRARTNSPRNWTGLGLAVGLGLLSKASFVVIALPVLTLALVASHWKWLAAPSVPSLFKSGIVGVLIAGPWWISNFRPTLEYAHWVTIQDRITLGRPSFATFGRWLDTVFLGLVGPGLSILLVLIGGAWLLSTWKRPTTRKVTRTAVLIGCTLAILPLAAVQLSGTNHLLRYMAPAMIPLALLAGVLSHETGWFGSPWARVASMILIGAQTLMLVYPVVFPNTHALDPGLPTGGLPWRTMIRFDQWDWTPVKQISRDCGLTTPRISFLGNGRSFNWSQIRYAWFVEGQNPPEVTWLWQYEKPPLNWRDVMVSIGESDIVVTAPNYIGQLTDRQDTDNRYNAEFAQRLYGDKRFRGPIRLQMGRFESVEVLVFVKSTLACATSNRQIAAR